MSPWLGWMACGVCLLFATDLARAAESVRFVGFAGREPAPGTAPALFGNREQEIDLEIDGAASPSSTLSADLFQVAGTLAMPLTKNLVLQKGLAVADISRLRVSVKFPDVKQRAEILLRLALISDADPSKRTALGDLRFQVFPPSLTRDLTDLLQPPSDLSQPLVVFGPGRRLRQFLAGLHVRFEDAGEDVPSNFDPSRRYAGEITGDNPFQVIRDRSAGARVAVFSPDDTLPPGVYADRTGSGALVQVTAPLLDHVADDPRAQLGLIKIFRLLSNSSH